MFVRFNEPIKMTFKRQNAFMIPASGIELTDACLFSFVGRSAHSHLRAVTAQFRPTRKAPAELQANDMRSVHQTAVRFERRWQFPCRSSPPSLQRN